MKKHTSIMPGIGQRLLIFSVLTFLIANGLPSFFGQHDSIIIEQPLSNTHVAASSPTLTQLRANAAERGIIISQLDTEKQQVTTLTFIRHDSEIRALQEQLRTELGQQAVIRLSQQTTAPTWLTSLTADPIKLGLDLSGGALFVLEVDYQTAISERLGNIAQDLKNALRKARLTGSRVSLNTAKDGVLLHIPASNEDSASETLVAFAKGNDGLMVKQSLPGHFQLYFSEQQQNTLRQQYLQQALTTMRQRVEQLGITEGVVQQQGKTRIRIEIPGIKDLQQAERLIGATASLSKKPIFTGTNITDAQMGRDEQGLPMVSLVLSGEGGQRMSAFSRDNIGRPMTTLYAEYLRNENGDMVKTERVISVATIQAVLGQRFSITNLDSPQAAHDLALLLRSGSLDAPVTIVEKRIINASLGEKNVQLGMMALGLGIMLTMLFMLLSYRRLGLIANATLLFNLACLTGLMALMPNAVLTLPGIAGLVLTVGMAVDTNVLVFERIRYERHKGVPPALALLLGYKRAWITILDANVTTLICALIMLSIGYGPVKGFAITLALGLLTSVFTGVALSKALSALVPANWLMSDNGAVTK